MIAELLVLAGAALTLVSAIGMARFRDVYVRMHALSKASTLGLLLAVVGAALGLTDANDITSLVLAALLQLVTGPVAANALSRATYEVHGYPPRDRPSRDAPEGTPANGDALG